MSHFQGQTQKLSISIRVSESLKSMVSQQSKVKKSTTITSTVHSNTPLLREKSCAEKKSYIWSVNIAGLPKPASSSCLCKGREFQCNTWQRTGNEGTRQGGKLVSEIMQCSYVIPRYLLLVILRYRRLWVLYQIILFHSQWKVSLPMEGELELDDV